MVGVAWLTFWIVPGLGFDGEWYQLVILALVVGAANAVVIPILKLLALPIRIVTLGIATLAINLGVMFLLIAGAEAVDLGVTSDGAWSNLLGALVLTVGSSLVSWVVRER